MVFIIIFPTSASFFPDRRTIFF